MNPARPSCGVVVRFRRPPARRPISRSELALAPRIEGSLAGVAILAPVIPIFPALSLAAPARAAASGLPPLLG